MFIIRFQCVLIFDYMHDVLQFLTYIDFNVGSNNSSMFILITIFLITLSY